MRVLLIDPMMPCDGQINLGLLYLASYADSIGHEVRMVDMNFRRQDVYDRLDRAIAELHPDVVGISIMTYFAFKEVLNVARKVMAKTPAPIVVGGQSPTMFPRKMLAENSEFDFLVFGEGELTFAELLNALSRRSDNFANIKGLAYRKDGQVFVNEKRPVIDDLDSLPMLKFELIDIVAKYGFRYYLNTYTMDTTRGCPFSCTFCLANVLSGRRWRAHSAKRVVDEIEVAYQKYGLKRVSFQDDNFIMRPQRVVDICRGIKERGLHIRLNLDGGVRADRLTKESLDAMCEVGIESGVLAVESGSPKVFDMIDKGESLETIERTLDMLKAAKINFPVFMILGLPTDTHETFLESIAFAKKHGVKCRWHFAVPFEGTRMYDWVVEHGRFLRDCTGYDIDIESNNDVVTPGTFPLSFDTPEYPAAQRVRDYYTAVMDSETFFYIMGAKYKGKLMGALRCLLLVLKYRPQKVFAYLRTLTVLGVRFAGRKLRGL